MHKESLITGVGVTNQGGKFWPEIEWRAPDGTKGRSPMPNYLDFSLSQQRECIGHRPPGGKSLIPCPNGALGVSKCETCEEGALLIPCMRCRGDRCRNPARSEECIQPDNHALYFVAYAPGVYKVGVAIYQRRWRRVWEQGARAGIVAMIDDGLKIRRWERMISMAGVPDRWSHSAHLQALNMEGNPEEFVGELRQIASNLQRRFPTLPWLAELEEQTFPHTYRPAQMPSQWDPAGGVRIAGNVKDVWGRVAIVERDDSSYGAVNLGLLVGYRLTVEKGKWAYQRSLPMAL